MAAFIAEHQNFFIPVITWGGLFILLFVTFSPFLVIRHPRFHPTRWWHVVGAYIASFGILFIYWQTLNIVDELFFDKFITTWELYKAAGDMGIYFHVGTLFGYPLFVFYSAKLMYGGLDKARVVVSSIVIASILAVILVAFTVYMIAYYLGQIGMEHF